MPMRSVAMQRPRPVRFNGMMFAPTIHEVGYVEEDMGITATSSDIVHAARGPRRSSGERESAEMGWLHDGSFGHCPPPPSVEFLPLR